jgi:glycosyltransferase involved in cell wall biosynthesis
VHVLVAAHDFYPDPGSGGTGRYVHETASRLVAQGQDVSVVTRRRGDVPTRETIEGVDVYRYDLSVAETTLPSILGQFPEAIDAVDRHVTAARRVAGPPDVLSFQGPMTSLLVDRSVGDDATTVTTFHSPWPTEYRIKTRGAEGGGLRRFGNIELRRYLEGRVLDRSDHVVTLSEYMLAMAERVHDRSLAASVVPGGVDADRFTPTGPTDRRIDGEPAFLTVRRLSARMGHELLLSAFADVLESQPAARLYLAGDGPRRDSLEGVARAVGVEEETTFLGYVPDDDLPTVYRSADVFVLPTTELEGFGLATLEALASGLPVVGTPVGGTVELLSELEEEVSAHGPLLVDRVEETALATAMLDWADQAHHARETIGRTCRRYVRQRYSWDRTARRLQSLYAGLDTDGNHRPRSIRVGASPR